MQQRKPKSFARSVRVQTPDDMNHFSFADVDGEEDKKKRKRRKKIKLKTDKHSQGVS